MLKKLEPTLMKTRCCCGQSFRQMVRHAMLKCSFKDPAKAKTLFKSFPAKTARLEITQNYLINFVSYSPTIYYYSVVGIHGCSFFLLDSFYHFCF